MQTRAFEPGELALPGSRILTIVRLDPVEAVFFVPNRELAAAVAGGRVTVRADAYPGRSSPA
ncbi:MAG: HlyD family efflux transporter periplasmic adaptor subunit [Proteobacteria bacterium]|nr:HlyD family efflux transporter periplasmic adaptor subunit [Pseudomonadota bacterium]